MPVFNNRVFNPNPYVASAQQAAYYNNSMNTNQIVYVHGIDGANAYQLPPNVTQQILWDDTVDSFYVKGYDQNGLPRVIAWNDFAKHVEPEKPKAHAADIDMSSYATKNDIKTMLERFMTKDDFEKSVSRLSVGERGRIVMTDEHDA